MGVFWEPEIAQRSTKAELPIFRSLQTFRVFSSTPRVMTRKSKPDIKIEIFSEKTAKVLQPAWGSKMTSNDTKDLLVTDLHYFELVPTVS